MKYEKDKITVIIPVYNVENYLERCLKSILYNTYTNLEIICVNDGSTDESGKILKTLEREDVRIILLEQNNQGVAAARNLGVKKSTGKYITFVDGDDYLKNDYIEKMYDLAEKESLDMVISGLTYVDESGKVIYDNEANVESMDNHGHRKEIREAEINGEGADERMSSTLPKKQCIMQYALKMAMC